MDRDFNLLFGIFAVQLRGITPSQFVDVAAAWAADPSRDLPHRMVEAGLLTDKDEVVLRGLVEEAVRCHDGDAKAALASFGGEERVSQILSGSEGSQDLFSLTQRLGINLVEQVTDPEAVPAIDETPGRYSHPKERSRGGMGHILLVHDQYIGRDIALKELLPPSDAPETTPPEESPVRASMAVIQRFLREAKITGQLEHPSIVPVYELGRRPNGHLYYTMKLVRGRTLGKALKDAGTLKERLGLLSHFVDLCQAIGYAHSRGVIHRDIKPLNIMVGEFGETVVIDWGLAKVQGRDDLYASELEKTIGDFRQDKPQRADLTSAGAIVGTPDYMSPEQAEGRIADVDNRSDVFSLGAVLYEILTGRRPFPGKSTREVLDHVISQPTPPIHSVEPDAPPELVGICEKALKKVPDERYQSAKEMADDILRFQSGALVQAYEYSIGELARHFYTKHKASLNTAAAALVVLLLVAVYSYVSILRARDREHEQRIAAEQAQQAAVAARNLEAEARGVAEHEAYVSQILLVQAYMDDRNYKLANETLWDIDESQRNWEWGYLLNRCNQDLFTLPDQLGAEYSPDGSRIVTVTRYGPPRLWDAETGTPVRTMTGRTHLLSSVTFSPDGTRVVAPSRDRTARIWQVETGKPVATLSGHSGDLQSAEFNPDSALVVTASDDMTAKVWDASSGSEVATLRGHSDVVWRAAFHPSGAPRILTVSKDGTAKMWDVAGSPKLLFTLTGRRARFSPDGKRVAGLQGPAALVWNADSGATLTTFTGHAASVENARFSPDGKRVVTACSDGTAKAWDANTGSDIVTYDHGGEVKDAAFSPDGTLLLTFSLEGLLKVWKAETGYELTSLSGHSDTIRKAAFSPDSTRIITASADGTVKVWNALKSSGQFIVARHAGPVTDLAFSHDANRLGTISWDRTLKILDAQSGAELATCANYARFGGASLAFTTQGHMAAALDEFTPMVWDIDSQTILTAFTGHSGRVYHVAFSPDGSKVVSASWDNTARVWDAQTGEELVNLDGHTNAVRTAVYSPDGTRILTASEDKTARVWHAQTGAEILSLKNHSGEVYSAAYSNDGSRIVTASGDRTAKVWDAETGEEKGSLAGHSGAVYSCAFSPDGKHILTASSDGTAKLWDATTGDELVTLAGHSGGLYSAEFSLDGTCILTASYDGTVRRWEAAPWRDHDMPGDGAMAWKDRFDQYKSQKLRAPAPKASSARAGSLVVVTTREKMRERLERLRDVLRSERKRTPEPAVGLRITEGPRLNALARLCFFPDDRIVRLNETEITNLDAAIMAIENILSQADRKRNLSVTMGIIRDQRRIPVEFRFQEPRIVRNELIIDREQALKMVRRQHAAVVEDVVSLLEVNHACAREIGEPIDEPDGLNGLWMPSVNTPIERVLYLSLGIAPGDRIVRFDGAPITSVDGLRKHYEKIISVLEAGEAYTLTQEIERGEFQHIELVVKVE